MKNSCPRGRPYRALVVRCLVLFALCLSPSSFAATRSDDWTERTLGAVSMLEPAGAAWGATQDEAVQAEARVADVKSIYSGAARMLSASGEVPVGAPSLERIRREVQRYAYGVQQTQKTIEELIELVPSNDAATLAALEELITTFEDPKVKVGSALAGALFGDSREESAQIRTGLQAGFSLGSAVFVYFEQREQSERIQKQVRALAADLTRMSLDIGVVRESLVGLGLTVGPKAATQSVSLVSRGDGNTHLVLNTAVGARRSLGLVFVTLATLDRAPLQFFATVPPDVSGETMIFAQAEVARIAEHAADHDAPLVVHVIDMFESGCGESAWIVGPGTRVQSMAELATAGSRHRDAIVASDLDSALEWVATTDIVAACFVKPNAALDATRLAVRSRLVEWYTNSSSAPRDLDRLDRMLASTWLAYHPADDLVVAGADRTERWLREAIASAKSDGAQFGVWSAQSETVLGWKFELRGEHPWNARWFAELRAGCERMSDRVRAESSLDEALSWLVKVADHVPPLDAPLIGADVSRAWESALDPLRERVDDALALDSHDARKERIKLLKSAYRLILKIDDGLVRRATLDVISELDATLREDWLTRLEEAAELIPDRPGRDLARAGKLLDAIQKEVPEGHVVHAWASYWKGQRFRALADNVIGSPERCAQEWRKALGAFKECIDNTLHEALPLGPRGRLVHSRALAIYWHGAIDVSLSAYYYARYKQTRDKLDIENANEHKRQAESRLATLESEYDNEVSIDGFDLDRELAKWIRDSL